MLKGRRRKYNTHKHFAISEIGSSLLSSGQEEKQKKKFNLDSTRSVDYCLLCILSLIRVDSPNWSLYKRQKRPITRLFFTEQCIHVLYCTTLLTSTFLIKLKEKVELLLCIILFTHYAASAFYVQYIHYSIVGMTSCYL